MRPAREEAGCVRVKRRGSRLAVIGVSCLALTTVALAGPAAAAWRGEEYCAVVKQTSDGFLAVRDGPDVKTKLVAMLRSGYPLTVNPSAQYLDPDDLKRYPNWTNWVFVRGDFSGDTHADSGHGYVYNKYIKRVPCGSSKH